MSLRPSEIERILFDNNDESDNESCGASGSELDDNILSYSGSDDYEPSSDEQSSENSSEDDVPNIIKKRKTATVGEKNSIAELLESMDAETPTKKLSRNYTGKTSVTSTTIRTSRSTTTTANPSTNDTGRPTASVSSATINTSRSTTTENPSTTDTSRSTASVSSPTIRTIRVIKGKNGHRWTEEPRNASIRAREFNVVHISPKVKGKAKNATCSSESFLSFITEEHIEMITNYTNSEILIKQRKYNEHTATVSITNIHEIKALIGLLLFSAVHRDNSLNTTEMFDTTVSGNIYKATFSEKRFTFLIDCLRFDEKETRPQRRENDKLAAIREFWQSFIQNCIENYEPGPYIVIDEQLLAFRGRCPFKMYLPSKPSKYGLKIVLLCDVGTRYMLNAEPYIGKNSTPANTPLSLHFVKTLTAPYHGSKRNVTMDNWFSSIPLAKELMDMPYKLTVLGTIRKNKRELPTIMVSPKDRAVGDTQYLFDGTVTLLSQKVKTNKVVCLISTMHTEKGTAASGKPFIVEHYNQTKGGVDAFDQMCSGISCSRKTRRWPLCLFYGMVNMAGINAWITRNSVLRQEKKTEISRKTFLMEVFRELTTPWLERRYQIPTLQLNLKKVIGEVLVTHMGRPLPEEQVQRPLVNTRTTCKFCPSSKRRMTTNHCILCNKAYCNEHRALVCNECMK